MSARSGWTNQSPHRCSFGADKTYMEPRSSPRKDDTGNRTDGSYMLCGWNMCEDVCKCFWKQMSCCDGIVAHKIALRKDQRQTKLLPRIMRTRRTTESLFTTCSSPSNSSHGRFVHFSDINAYMKDYRTKKTGVLDVRTPTPDVPIQGQGSVSAPVCQALEDIQITDLSTLTLATVRVHETSPEQRESRRLKKKKTEKTTRRDESTEPRSKIVRTAYKRSETQQKFRWLSAKPCKLSSIPTLSQSITYTVLLGEQRRQSASI
ncbi:uncharacterized protein LOC117121971 [Anneissia japonica]|uniref:uncharacterized protein LOC117121971 n=1 Tax=Anneissia japonica TaxID=1529436 RepID=UPI001425791B|nr:uncharacterized protein LOC117121971 [Anneissia japonica]